MGVLNLSLFLGVKLLKFSSFLTSWRGQGDFVLQCSTAQKRGGFLLQTTAHKFHFLPPTPLNSTTLPTPNRHEVL